MESMAAFKARKTELESVGVYHRDDETQHIGYWKGTRSNGEFISVCVIPINSPFQEELVQAVKKKLQTY